MMKSHPDRESDVHIRENDNKIVCSNCLLKKQMSAATDEHFICDKPEEILRHLRIHENQDHYVPQQLFASFKE